MINQDKIEIRGLRQNNLKNVSLDIPKGKIVVFTGVSGSGKSSIVFDTIAAESQRQMNETYTAFIRGRLPKYEKPKVERIDNLSASVIVDQSRLGGNARSTVGTISDMYAALRLLYSRIGTPYVGTASYFSFNDPNGMCPECSGIGKVMTVDIEGRIDPEKTWNEGMADLPAFHVGNWYWKQYACTHNLKHVSVDISLEVLTVVTGVAGSGKSSLIRDVFAKQYADRVVLVDQSPVTATGRSTPATFLGFFDEIRKVMAAENGVDASLFSFNSKGACPVCGGRGQIVTELVFMDPVTTVCEACEGKRYSDEALSYRYHGKNIVNIMNMSAGEAYEFFKENKKLRKALGAMLEVGLPYLSLGQPLSTLSGGERQRVKLAKYLDKQGNIYVLDEPTTGLHASDVQKIMKLLDSLVDRGNTVIVIEHSLDVMKQSDWLIDVGPDGGTAGGEIVFTGTPKEMAEHGKTITAEYLRKSL